MAMTYNSEGHLILDIARGKYRLYSFLLLIAAYYIYATSPTSNKDEEILVIIHILSAIVLLWRSFFYQPFIFDTHQKCIFRGRHLVARFSDIEYIEQRRHKTNSGHIFYWVRLHLRRSHKLTLGYQDSNVAITIANLMEKPVRGGDSWLGSWW
jgi:hypothetical protein